MKLLELRNKMNEKKPNFLRQDFHKKRLRKRWVKPRGLHSKVRLRMAGHPCRVSVGYGSPREVRGLSRDGFKIRRIFNENDLNNVDNKKEGIIIAKDVSVKNKILLLKKAKEKGIKVLNLNADEYLKRKEEEINKRLAEKKKEEKKEKEKKEEKKKEKLEEKLSEEETKEKEKKERDKLLTKRER